MFKKLKVFSLLFVFQISLGYSLFGQSNSVFSSSDTIASSVLDKKIKKVIKEFKLEGDDFSVIFEPPGICRGIHFSLGHDSKLYLFIERTVYSSRRKFKIIARQKVIGGKIVLKNEEAKYFGEGIPVIF